MSFSTLAVVLLCLAAGGGLGWFAARSRAAAEIARLEATLAAVREGEGRLEQSMRALSYEATAQSQEAVARAVAPLHDTLRRYESRVAELERDRVDAYAELREQVRAMSAVSGELRTETKQLVAALRAPQVRGRWGEHQLRRIVEAAGMLEHCDFDEQVTAATDHQGVRPDLVVRLHGGRSVVVDAKAPFDAYLTAMEARDERGRDSHLDAHARHLRAHVDALAAKSYWAAFDPAPEFVVLFVPADPFLDVALQRDPALLEHAFARNVVLATPATLVALLRTVAYSWRQEALARNAVAVHTLARELYGRLSTLGDHVGKLGSALGGAVTAYNRAVGSLEARVLVSARKLAELGVSGAELATPAQVEVAPRQPQAPELVEPPSTVPERSTPADH
ncbi:DNA recombination protein RmuC [Micromonospora olivasterospora]|uniref:DNA recombination protein RmuC n=1 Tax=Micromonospora olivasterospora TaxID=1880 RepID=A0A562IBM3_MICOL|nr:DNA recombination protein RmuC [Micromonospora olivasterospora]TWH68401.1 DNA recombination protein RmuC [Micromonospora olivasterospora]